MSVLLKAWMDKATKEQIVELADHAGTSVGYLYQLASNRRFPSADIASRIEQAAELMSRTQNTPGLLPRDFIASVCSACPYALRCRTQNPKGEN